MKGYKPLFCKTVNCTTTIHCQTVPVTALCTLMTWQPTSDSTKHATTKIWSGCLISCTGLEDRPEPRSVYWSTLCCNLIKSDIISIREILTNKYKRFRSIEKLLPGIHERANQIFRVFSRHSLMASLWSLGSHFRNKRKEIITFCLVWPARASLCKGSRKGSGKGSLL